MNPERIRTFFNGEVPSEPLPDGFRYSLYKDEWSMAVNGTNEYFVLRIDGRACLCKKLPNGYTDIDNPIFYQQAEKQ